MYHAVSSPPNFYCQALDILFILLKSTTSSSNMDLGDPVYLTEPVDPLSKQWGPEWQTNLDDSPYYWNLPEGINLPGDKHDSQALENFVSELFENLSSQKLKEHLFSDFDGGETSKPMQSNVQSVQLNPYFNLPQPTGYLSFPMEEQECRKADKITFWTKVASIPSSLALYTANWQQIIKPEKLLNFSKYWGSEENHRKEFSSKECLSGLAPIKLPLDGAVPHSGVHLPHNPYAFPKQNDSIEADDAQNTKGTATAAAEECEDNPRVLNAQGSPRSEKATCGSCTIFSQYEEISSKVLPSGSHSMAKSGSSIAAVVASNSTFSPTVSERSSQFDHDTKDGINPHSVCRSLILRNSQKQHCMGMLLAKLKQKNTPRDYPKIAPSDVRISPGGIPELHEYKDRNLIDDKPNTQSLPIAEIIKGTYEKKDTMVYIKKVADYKVLYENEGCIPIFNAVALYDSTSELKSQNFEGQQEIEMRGGFNFTPVLKQSYRSSESRKASELGSENLQSDYDKDSISRSASNRRASFDNFETIEPSFEEFGMDACSARAGFELENQPNEIFVRAPGVLPPSTANSDKVPSSSSRASSVSNETEFKVDPNWPFDSRGRLNFQSIRGPYPDHILKARRKVAQVLREQ